MYREWSFYKKHCGRFRCKLRSLRITILILLERLGLMSDDFKIKGLDVCQFKSLLEFYFMEIFI